MQSRRCDKAPNHASGKVRSACSAERVLSAQVHRWITSDRQAVGMARKKKPRDPFRWFDSSPEVIRLVAMMYVRYPLSLRNVEDLLFERGIDICHETVRLWWNRLGPMFASEIRRLGLVEGRHGVSPARVGAESALTETSTRWTDTTPTGHSPDPWPRKRRSARHQPRPRNAMTSRAPAVRVVSGIIICAANGARTTCREASL